MEGSDRGAKFGKEEHDSVDDLVGQLEQYAIPEPLKSPFLFGGMYLGAENWIYAQIMFNFRHQGQALNEFLY